MMQDVTDTWIYAVAHSVRLLTGLAFAVRFLTPLINIDFCDGLNQ